MLIEIIDEYSIDVVERTEARIEELERIKLEAPNHRKKFQYYGHIVYMLNLNKAVLATLQLKPYRHFGRYH